MRLLIPLLTALAALAACTPTIQTSSGADYVAARSGSIDPEIAKIAAVEPDLKFPARIGVARVVNGALTIAPPAEADLWVDFTTKHAALGTFVPISPLVNGMVNGTVNGRARRATIDELRRASARQHVDYLLVYELGARSQRTSDTPFALADITLIGGAFLPTRRTGATGVGSAALIDVRNGYPYGSTQATVALSGFARTFAADRASEHLRDRATHKVAEALLPRVDEMLAALIEASR